MSICRSSGALALAAALVAIGCEPSGSPKSAKSSVSQRASNLLLISIDTLRSDHSSAYGYPRETTPRLAELSRSGAHFEQAYSATASTAPSHATLFTGRHPITHGLVKNGLALAESSQTLAEVLKGEGYQTAAAVGSFVLDPRFGFAQGFDSYDAEFELPSLGARGSRAWHGHEVDLFDRRAEDVTDAALGWFRDRRDSARPFFLFVHYFDPHHPYAPPGAHALRFVEPGVKGGSSEHESQLYDGEIAYTDSEVGRLLDALDREGLVEDTLVVWTGDHGEGLGEHGVSRHAVNLYEEAVRVPLGMRLPGVVAAGQRIAAPVGAIDIAPTILDLLGIDSARASHDGASLADALRAGRPLDSERAVFLHRRPYPKSRVGDVILNGSKVAVRRGRWKYLEEPDQGTREVYDLAVDPDESENRLGRDPQRARELAGILAAWRSRFGTAESVAPIPEDARAGLEALGYIE